MILVGHILDHMLNHVLDHIIIGLVTMALYKYYWELLCYLSLYINFLNYQVSLVSFRPLAGFRLLALI